jgi:hypothetical protein
VLVSNLGRATRHLNEVFYGFLNPSRQMLVEYLNEATVASFVLIIHQSFHHLMLYSLHTEGVIK